MKARKEIGEFKSFYQFCEKVDLRLLNKRVMESLIKSGAMDALGRRAQLMAVARQRHGACAEDAARRGVGAAWTVRRLRRGQPERDERARCRICPTGMSTRGWPTRKRFSASSSPGIRWRSTRRSWSDFHALTTERSGELKSRPEGREFTVGGVMLKGIGREVEARRPLRAGQIEDMNGSVRFALLCRRL